VVEARVVGVAGGTEFGEAVNAVLSQWRVESSAECGHERVAFLAYVFNADREFDPFGLRLSNPYGGGGLGSGDKTPAAE
jgi:hypothetical protein